MIKLTKNELRSEQNRLQLLNKYLPTLQLKKAMLQTEVSEAKNEIAALTLEFAKVKESIDAFSAVLNDPLMFEITDAYKVQEVKKHYENIAGVEVPELDDVLFEPFTYRLIDTPAWVDSAILKLKQLAIAKVKISIGEEKKAALENELREVSIRVNLFEKILIPRALQNIKKIKIFLGDQQLAAVSRAKVAKAKITGNACESM